MNYRELYASLSPLELRSVAARARLPLEDVQQEALLRCWEIARGRCDYDARRGTVRRYVMAKLWGLAARESELPRAAGIEACGEALHAGRAAPARPAAVSVLDELLEREAREEADRRAEKIQWRLRRRYAGLSTTGVLLDQGISSVRIAVLIGVTPQAVRQRVARERARIRRGRGLRGGT